MTQDSEIFWHLDAWDPIAGRAFICQRAPDGEAVPNLDHIVFFVAPPFFDAEPLASRAPGIAAARGSFQLGLFIDGIEVGFASLADAIAFVRRGYNSPGSDPSPATPITDPEGPKDGGFALKLERAESPPLDAAIAQLLANFASEDGRLRLNGPARDSDWQLKKELTLGDGRELLFTGATALTAEMLRRCPTNGPPQDLMEWLMPAHRLGRYLVWLHVWDEVIQSLANAIPEGQVDAFSRRFATGSRQFERTELIRLLFGQYSWWEHVLGAELDDPVLSANFPSNVYDDLASFPLPRDISPYYPPPARRHPTLLTMIATWFGHPLRLHESTGNVDRALLLFAGACVVIQQWQRSDALPRTLTQTRLKIANAFFERLSRESWDWIAAQLPDRRFHTKLEDTLAGLWTIPGNIRAAQPGESAAYEFDGEDVSELDNEDIAILQAELGELIEPRAEGPRPTLSA